jgi:hypothetical protein
MTDTELEHYLLDEPDQALRRAACIAVLADPAAPLRAQSKAATWMAYRALESGQPAERTAATGWLQDCLTRQPSDPDEFWRARWGNSLTMALAYLECADGADPRPRLRALARYDWIAANPPGMVNACRAMSLLAAAESRAADSSTTAATATTPPGATASTAATAATTRALDLCHDLFRFGCTRVRLADVPACAGAELVLAAKAVQITVALLPHLHQPHRGPITPLPTILALDPTAPYPPTLSRLLH